MIDKNTTDFILEHRNDDVRKLALQASRRKDVDMAFALDQIAGWQTARRKLPSWAAVDGIIYPPRLSMEQCSSEMTARYKACISEEGRTKSEESNTKVSEERRVKNEESNTEGSEERPFAEDIGKGQEIKKVYDSSLFTLRSSLLSQNDSSFFTLPSSLLIDLTGGFGVDFSFMSRGFGRAVYVERQEHLCEVARNNFALLGLDNAEVVCGDGVEYLHSVDYADVIYLDPARRDNHGARTYAISDCTPDILAMEQELLDKAGHVILKLSPMLDITKTIADLEGKDFKGVVKEVHVVSVANECKELLVVLSKNNNAPLTIHCVNLIEVRGERLEVRDMPTGRELAQTNDNIQTGKGENGNGIGNNTLCSYSLTSHPLPLTPSKALTSHPSLLTSIIHEPNASIMKVGCFAQLCARYGVTPLGHNSHLFVSSDEIADFPGRSFRIISISSMNKKELKSVFAGITKANITVRNFPMSVVDLRKRLKLSDGGDIYIFATTVNNKHLLIITKKI